MPAEEAEITYFAYVIAKGDVLKADKILECYDLVDLQRAYALIRTEQYIALEKSDKDKEPRYEG